MILPFLIGLMWAGVYGQRRPPNYGQGQMPETAFSCRDKIIGGYYADPETDCQMFHVCVKIPGKGVQDFRFLCPNDTSFDQENQICDDWYNIDCEASTLFYSDNFDLYRLGGDLGRIGGKLSAVNNAVGEGLDDNYLHKADRGDNVPQDLLRGSQSGNFFSNRNGGREDYDDEDYKPKRKQVHDKAAKQQLKKPQEPLKESAYHIPKEQSRFQHRNSNFRNQHRNQPVTAAPTTEQPATTVTTKPVRGQPYRHDVLRQRSSAATTTVRPLAQDNSYSPTTTTLKPLGSNNYIPTTVRPHGNFNHNFNNQHVSTTLKPQGNFNQNNFNQNNFNNQHVSTTLKPQANFNQNNFNQNFNNQHVSTTLKPQTFNAQQPTTIRPNYQYNNNQGTAVTTIRPNYQHFQQPQQTTAKNYVDVSRQSPQQHLATQTQKPFSNAAYQPNNPSPTNYQQSYTTASQQSNYNAQHQNTYATPLVNNYNPQKTQTTAQANNNQNANYNQNYNNQQPNYNAYTTQQQNYNHNAYTQKPQTFNNNAQTQTQTPYNANAYSTQKSFSQSYSETTEVTRVNPNQYNHFNVQRNNYNFGSTANPQTYSTNANQYSQNLETSRSTAKPFDSQTYRAPNHQYPDEQDEFLKTAHSQNLGSSLRKTFNASQAAAFNFIPSGTTGKPKKAETKTTDKSYQPSANSFGSGPTVQAYTPQKQYTQNANSFNSVKNNNYVSPTVAPTYRTTAQHQSTFPPQSPQKKVYSQTPDRSRQKPQPQQTTKNVSPTVNPKLTSPQPFSPAKPQPPASSDNNDYDYAYYDSAGPAEYEGIGNVEFRRTTPHRSSA